MAAEFAPSALLHAAAPDTAQKGAGVLVVPGAEQLCRRVRAAGARSEALTVFRAAAGGCTSPSGVLPQCCLLL